MKKLLTLMLLLLTVVNAHAFGQGKFKEEVEKEAGAVKLTREVMVGGYDILTTEELATLLKSDPSVLVVDTMPYEDSYKKAHIPAAQQFLFPIPEMTDWDSKETDGKSMEDYQALLGPDKERTIVVYCGFVKCTRSHNGALWAKKLGYNKVYRHPGGIYAWKGAGLDVESVE